jgi:hypothetical protein
MYWMQIYLYFKILNFKIHVTWVPCHHGMACPQVADGGNGPQIWRIAANILNKQSQTADKGWSSGLGVGLTTPHHKILPCYENSQETSEMGRLLWTRWWTFRFLKIAGEFSEWLHNWQLLRKDSALYISKQVNFKIALTIILQQAFQIGVQYLIHISWKCKLISEHNHFCGCQVFRF